MTHLDDDSGDMRDHPTFDDRTVEALLAGRTPVEHDDLAPVAELIGHVRTLGDGPTPAPSAALAAVLRDGLPPAASARARADAEDLPAVAGITAGGGTRSKSGRSAGSRLTRWRRSPAMLSALLAWVAGLSMVGKAAVAVTAAGALAGGGMAIGLPGAVSDAFERRDVEEIAPTDGSEEAGEPEAPAIPEGEAPQDASPEEVPATDASAEGRQRAIDGAHDSHRVPGAVGPRAGDGQPGEDGGPDGAPGGAPGGAPDGAPAAPPAEDRAPDPLPPSGNGGEARPQPAPAEGTEPAPAAPPAGAADDEGTKPQATPAPQPDDADEQAGATQTAPPAEPGSGPGTEEPTQDGYQTGASSAADDPRS